jgi:serine/threonine protein kinase/tetratricopeptide (TPR) repeat protein
MDFNRPSSAYIVLSERYKVGDVIARGGMSILYTGVDTRTGMPVAIKVMHKLDGENQEKRRRFRLEIEAAGRLDHPNVVRVLDSGESEDHTPYLVMELLQGRSLELELERRGRLSLANTLEWILPLVGALAYAHDRGVVHRDVKPANIFLAADGKDNVIPKLVDFGISVVTGATRVTRSGMVVGTVHYMSPEQACDAEVGPSTDIWSIGAVVYRCLAGVSPFEGRTAASTLLKIVKEPAPDLGPRVKELGPKLTVAIYRALRKNPQRRYPDMRSFARALCISARGDGIRLPDEPDRIGLKDWALWCSGDSLGDSTTGGLALSELVSQSDEDTNRAVGSQTEDETGRRTVHKSYDRPLLSLLPSRFGNAAPFVGRDFEIETFVQTLKKVDSGAGQIVAVSAEAGVGKSRLLAELKRKLKPGHYQYLEGHCLQYRDATGYLPILDMLRRYFGIDEGDGVSQIEEKLHLGLTELGGLSPDTLHSLQYLFSVKPQDEPVDANDIKVKRNRLFESLSRFFIRISEEKPLVLAVENTHWIDDVSHQFLDHFTDAVANHRILLIVLYRPPQTLSWSEKSFFTEIPLRPLDNQWSRRLLESLFEDGEVTREVRDFILERARGNPLFIEELSRTLLESGPIKRRGQRYLLDSDRETIALPSSLQEIIAYRIESLEENLKRTMQVASVVGSDFAYRILSAITGTHEELTIHLSQLSDRELIFKTSHASEPKFTFKHALTRDMAYGSLAEDRKKDFHNKAGSAIESVHAERLEEYYEILAFHYVNAENNLKAYRYLRLSGEKAVRNFSNRDAVRYFQQALETLDSLPQSRENLQARLEVCVQMDIPLSIMGYPDGSLENLLEREKLSKQLGDGRNLALAYSRMNIYFALKGDPVLGKDGAENSLKEALESGDIALIVSIAANLSETYLATGDHEKIVQVAPKVIALLEKEHREKELLEQPINPYSWLCNRTGVAMALMGDFEQGKHYLKKSLSNAEKVSHLLTRAACHTGYGAFAAIRSDGKSAVEHAQKSLRIFREANWTWVESPLLAVLAWGYYLIGDIASAKEQIVSALALQENSMVSFWASLPFYAAGMIDTHLGAYSDARQYGQRALEKSVQCKDRVGEALAFSQIGVTLYREDISQFAEAEASLLKSKAILEAMNIRSFLAGTFMYLGELYASSGDRDKAVVNLQKAQEMLQQMGIKRWQEETRQIISRL